MLATIIAVMIAALFLLCLFDDLFDAIPSPIAVPIPNTTERNPVSAQLGPSSDDPERYFWKEKGFFIDRCDDDRFIQISKRELEKILGEIRILDRKKQRLGYRLLRMTWFKSSTRDLDAKLSDLNIQKSSIELSIKQARSRIRIAKHGRTPGATICTLNTTDRSLRSRPDRGT